MDMFKHLKKEMKRYGLVGWLLIVGIVLMIAFLLLLGTGTVRATPENENTFMEPIVAGDWWGALSSVYTNVIGGVFWAIMVILPVGMLYIKTRNSWPPTMLLIIGSAVFGVLFGSVVRVLMIIFIAFGIAIVLYKTFSKSGGGA